MMYLTVMRVRSKAHGRGINIFLHKRPGPVPLPPWSVVQNPGPKVEGVDRMDVQPGGSSVEAYLDFVMDNGAYSRQRAEDVAREIRTQLLSAAAPNPLQIRSSPVIGGPTIHAAFSVNLGLEDLASRLRVFDSLRAALSQWLAEHDTSIAEADRAAA